MVIVYKFAFSLAEKAMASSVSYSSFLKQYQANIPPLYTILASLTWVLHDYFITLEDEIKLVWSQRWNRGKAMYLWMRYYTIFLVAGNALQIHLFTRKGITSDKVCLAVDPVLRIAGAISLWTVEIIIQQRIYVIYHCSRKIAIFNAVLFVLSIFAFIGIIIDLAIGRKKLIAEAIHLPLAGCPVINATIQWSEWIPATIFEFILFSFALYKHMKAPDVVNLPVLKQVMKLTFVLVSDNMLYFLGITIVLVFNNLEVAGKTHIPWFSYGPFYASLGIMTCRMILHLLKSAVEDDKTQVLDWTKSSNQAHTRSSSTHLTTLVFE